MEGLSRLGVALLSTQQFHDQRQSTGRVCVCGGGGGLILLLLLDVCSFVHSLFRLLAMSRLFRFLSAAKKSLVVSVGTFGHRCCRSVCRGAQRCRIKEG